MSNVLRPVFGRATSKENQDTDLIGSASAKNNISVIKKTVTDVAAAGDRNKFSAKEKMILSETVEAFDVVKRHAFFTETRTEDFEDGRAPTVSMTYKLKGFDASGNQLFTLKKCVATGEKLPTYKLEFESKHIVPRQTINFQEAVSQLKACIPQIFASTQKTSPKLIPVTG